MKYPIGVLSFFAGNACCGAYRLQPTHAGGDTLRGRVLEQFPKLFSGDGKGSDTIPMVSEVNTINAVMKWQGFTEHQKVFDSNAIFIFSILNSMTKEAKAIEEANQKMKAKRK